MWQISNHLDLIVGLTWIGTEADVRLNQLDEEAAVPSKNGNDKTTGE